jgi:HSP20 family protein
MANPSHEEPRAKELVPEENTRPGKTYRPHVDIMEDSERLWLRADLPGVDEDSVDVSLEDGVLTLRGEVSLEPYENLQPVYTEYEVGNFEHQFRISSRIDANRIEARMNHGVLELELPKAAEARPRQINIRAS